MNRYLAEPELAELRTEVADSIPVPTGGWLVAGHDNLFRPAGGGQPDDYGTIEICGTQYPLAGLQKGKGGLVYAYLPDLFAAPATGAAITQHLDATRRERLRRLHSLQHLFSSEAARVAPEAEPCGTGLREEGSAGWIRLRFAAAINRDALSEIERRVQEDVTAGVPILIARANSVDEARTRYRSIFRLDPAVALSGKVRVVVIRGIDANCCSGTHWDSSAVGPYRVEMMLLEQDGAGSSVELRFELTEPLMHQALLP